MKKAAWAIVGVVALFVNSAIATDSFDPKGPVCSFEQLLSQFVKKEKAASRYNTFLVADTINHPSGEYWVYWPQGRELLLVGWPARECSNPSLVMKRRLDLSKDFVKTKNEVGSSTYLETEEWASQVLLSAAKSKYQYTIRK